MFGPKNMEIINHIEQMEETEMYIKRCLLFRWWIIKPLALGLINESITLLHQNWILRMEWKESKVIKVAGFEGCTGHNMNY